MNAPSDPTQLARALELAAQLDLAAGASVRTLAAELRSGARAADPEAIAAELLLDTAVLDALITLATEADLDRLASTRLAIETDLTSFYDQLREADAGATQESTRTGQEPGGRRIGKYRLLEQVGVGGMGVVYRSWDESLGRDVAVKLMHAEALDAGSGLVKRFMREARAAAGLRHPGIVAVHDVGEAEGRRYLTMDFVSGSTLREVLQERARAKAAGDPAGLAELARELDLLAQVAEAVGFAHQHGILHRDLKPENILIDDQGRALLTDFGLAKNIAFLTGDAREHTLTMSGAILGTLSYMSPEQARGEGDLLPATDTFGLGVMLYETLNGDVPFRGETVSAALSAIQEEDPRPPRRLQPRLHRDVESICLKALDKDARRRYPDGAALAADLRRHLSGEPVDARPPSWPRRVRSWVRRHRMPAALIVIALLLVMTAAAVSIQRQRQFERLQAVERDQRERVGVLRRRVETARAPWRVGNRASLAQMASLVQQDSASLLRENAELPEVYVLRGRMRFLSGDLESAAEDFAQAVRLAPDDPWPRLHRGRLLVTLYQQELTAQRRVWFLDLDRDLVGLASRETDDMRDHRERALVDLQAAGQARISSLERTLLAAHLAIANQEWEDAAELAEDALALDVSWEAYWLWGLALAGSNEQIPAAIEKLERAVFLGRGFAQAWMLLAEARTYELNLRRHAEDVTGLIPAALAALEEASRLGAAPERVRFLAAHIYWVWGGEDAVANRDPHPRYAQGIAYLAQRESGDPDAFDYFVEGRLREKYAQSILDPDVDRSSHLEAALAMQSLAVEMFAETYDGVVFAPGLRARAHTLRAIADVTYAAGGDPMTFLHKAIDDYSASLDTEPDNGSALLYRGGAHFEVAERLRLTARSDPAAVAAQYAACAADLAGMSGAEVWPFRGGALLWAAMEKIEQGQEGLGLLRRAQQDFAADLAAAGERTVELLLAEALVHLYAGRAAAARGEDGSASFRRAAELFAQIDSPSLWPRLRRLEAMLRGGADAGTRALLAECQAEAAGMPLAELAANHFDAQHALRNLRSLLEEGEPDSLRQEITEGLAAVAETLDARVR